METRASKRRKIMREMKPLPVEVWVKIFNFLSNHDIRCGVSLVCKKFQDICKDESLVPVKDLCIYGHPVGRKSKKKDQKGKQNYCLSGAVFDIIRQSKNLTTLKINALNSETTNELVSIALQSCPKLTTLEVFETPNQLDSEYNYKLMDTIMEHGKNLSSINLLILFGIDFDRFGWIFTEGCPKLKNLTLESLRGWKDDTYFKVMSPSPNYVKKHFFELWDLSMSKKNLEALYKGCKELKDLKLTKIGFWDVSTDEVKEILPNCNVELKECYYIPGCGYV